jgi:uncharacterized protein YicC (UPF0701 family)
MPIYSMTGFARVQIRVNDQLGYTLSVKSVNHRFLDVQLRLPSGLDALEVELRRALKENLVRGHVELTLSVERTGQQTVGYNRELVAGYLAAFGAAREDHVLTGQPDLNVILRLPGALQTDSRNSFDDDLTALTESVQREIGRSDVSEELAGMNTHIGHFRELLSSSAEVGKKLDFLLQEMNREANTLLSKTGGLGGKGTRITELGLAMKAEIEKAREQIQNVE